MATYYWVGGAGTWNSTSTANWSASSGGPGGAGYPTILDDVIFNTSSGTGTVSATLGLAFCRDLTVTASQALSFSGTLSVAGNTFLPSGGSVSTSGLNVTFIATSAKTITSNGKTLGFITFNGVNGVWTLQDAFSAPSSAINTTAGTLNTNNQSVTTGAFTSTGALPRSIILGASSIVITSWNSTTTGLTLDVGTSTLAFAANAAPTITTGGSTTFYNATFTASNNTSPTFNNDLTFNNLTFPGPSGSYTWFVILGGNITVNGTLTTNNPSILRRILFQSNTRGTQRTLNVNTWSASRAYLDFRDIALTGAVGTLSGTSFGDGGNNSGITFTAAQTVYWSGTSSVWENGWATSSGGTPSTNNFPLIQDTCIVDNNGFNAISISSIPWQIGNFDSSLRTTALTLTISGVSTVVSVYGDIIFGTGIVTAGNNSIRFVKYGGTQTLNTNGVAFANWFVINSASTLRLLSNVNFTSTNSTSTLTSGTLDLNNFTLSVTGGFVVSGTLPRSIAFGTGAITIPSLAANIQWDGTDLTNYSSTGTPTVNFTGAITSGTDRGIQHGVTLGGTEANAISINVSAGAIGSVTTPVGFFKNINLTGFAGTFSNTTRTVYGNLTIFTSTTVSAGGNITTFAGTSVTQDLISNGRTLDFPIVISGTGNTLRLLDAFIQGTTRAFTINSGTTFNANSFSASVGTLTFSATPSITNLVSGTLTANAVTHTAGNLIMSASLKINVIGTYTLTAGTLDLGNQSVSFGSFSSTNTNVRTINLGSGTLTLTLSGNVWNTSTVTNLTFNAGTSTISCTNAGTKQIVSGALTFYNINQGGLGALTIPAATFNSISNSVQPTTILFNSNTTATVANLNLNGTAGNLVTLSFSGATANYTIEYTGSTVNTMNFVSVSRFTGARSGIFFATNSTNGGNNTNITFAAADTTPRYWVGGTGTWTNTATANWSTSSGGGGGASAPTIETNVFFDAASNVGTGAFTVTLTGTGTSTLVCNDLSISGLDGTLTWTGTGDLNVYSSLSYPATNFSRSYAGSYFFRSNTTGKTITSNGFQITTGSVTFDGIGGGWTLADAFINTGGTGNITVTNGTFNTGGFAVTTVAISSSNSNVRAINLGASTVTISGSITFTTSTNLTFNAGTSNISSIGSGGTVDGGTGQTFHNFTFGSNALTQSTISGANTFNNLTLTPPLSSGATNYIFNANQTINGTLSRSGGSATQRTFFRSGTLGTQRTLTVNAFTTPTDFDFRDIAIAGTAAPVSGTRLGDCGGNSGITFDAPKTVYWNLAGTNSFTATAWATTPSGTPAVNNFPLAQDIAAFTDSGAITQVNLAEPTTNYPAIDMSARTSAMTINNSAAGGITTYGSWINGSGTTISSANTFNFSGRGSHVITSTGKTFPTTVVFNSISGTYTLTDAFISSSLVNPVSGTFNSANQTVTATSFSLSASLTRSVILETSTINLTGTGTVWDAATTTGLTFSGASSTINLTNTSATGRTIQGGGLTYGTLNIGGATGTSTLTLSGTGTTFNNITSTKTVAHTISISNATTINFNNFNVSGSAGNLVTLAGISTTSVYNYTGNSVVSVNYVSSGANCVFNPLPNVLGTTPYRWYLGANSTNTSIGISATTLGAAFISGTQRAYFINTSNTTIAWAVPSDWDNNNNTAHLIGGGGNGVSGVVSGNNRAAGGGGGGGGYTVVSNLPLIPGGFAGFFIGGTGSTKGGDTYIDANYLAGGGQGGSALITPSSSGGAGGVGTFAGGAGGAGAFGTTASQGYGGGGGGGAGGPLGVGGAGGAGFGSTTTANIAGGGGGGNGGGSAGANGASATGGSGGNNAAGSGGGVTSGANATAGSGGGGAGGAGSAGSNGVGSLGKDIANTLGGGGGTGGSGGGTTSGSALAYGAGSGGGHITTGGGTSGAPSATSGMMFIVYTPVVSVTTGNFFFLYNNVLQ